MKILITGGTGFIGSHLVNVLAEKGHQVVVVDCNKKQNKRNIQFYKIDITSPKVDLIFKKERPDIVYHLAAYAFVEARPSQKSINKIIKNNILGSFNIIEASRKYGVKKIIFSSSTTVYETSKKSVLSEKTPINPFTFYGMSKLTVEHFLKTYYKIYKLPYIIFRYTNIYGPGQKLTTGTAIVNFINNLLDNKQPIINGTGEQSKDFVYIDDVVKVNLIALKTKKVGIYNIGTGKAISLNKLFSKIRKILDKNIQPKYNHFIQISSQRCELDIRKVKKELNWQPGTSIDTGLRKTINHFKKDHFKK